mmetsp:Transcript_22289/g.71841  ORF Transcript_22289/g.71841 Transcript_22289/m.71841 type:complete len:308 (-) Transcript_22289:908-1831(-)
MEFVDVEVAGVVGVEEEPGGVDVVELEVGEVGFDEGLEFAVGDHAVVVLVEGVEGGPRGLAMLAGADLVSQEDPGVAVEAVLDAEGLGEVGDVLRGDELLLLAQGRRRREEVVAPDVDLRLAAADGPSEGLGARFGGVEVGAFLGDDAEGKPMAPEEAPDAGVERRLVVLSLEGVDLPPPPGLAVVLLPVEDEDRRFVQPLSVGVPRATEDGPPLLASAEVDLLGAEDRHLVGPDEPPQIFADQVLPQRLVGHDDTGAPSAAVRREVTAHDVVVVGVAPQDVLQQEDPRNAGVVLRRRRLCRPREGY